MKFPLVVFFAAALTVLVFVVGGFTCYHIHLAVSGQTTNERHKRHRHYKMKRVKLKNNYDFGIYRNLYDEFFPLYRPHSSDILKPKFTNISRKKRR